MDTTSVNMDDPIIVDKECFHIRWKQLHDKPIPSSILERVEYLKHTYPCFKIRSHKSQRPPYHKKETEQHTHDYDHSSTRFMRPRIGTIFTNMEGKARKNFIAFMNKLSPQNKNEILQNFIHSLVPENIHIYMDQIIKLFQIQPTYHDLYMEVLHKIMSLSPDRAKEFLEEHFTKFMQDEKYKIPENILENLDNLNTSPEQLDQLCEYVQWKKQTKALLLFYIHTLSLHIFGSLEDINRVFILLGKMIDINWKYPPIIDIYLDMTLHAVQSIYKYSEHGLKYNKNIISIYSSWNSRKDELRPSSKFKVMDILQSIS